MKKLSALLLFFLVLMSCSNAQNVGIGVAAPTARLQINHTSSSAPGLLLKDSAINASGLIKLQKFNSDKFFYLKGYDYNSSLNSFLDVGSDSSFIATFRGNGNVGIGNLGPNEKLDVAGNINLTGTIKANGVAGQPGQVLMANSGGTLSWSNFSEYPNFVSFISAGVNTWLVPAGVTRIMVEAWGGGAASYSAFSGGGGGYVRALLMVTSGSNVQVIVGVGGAGTMIGGFCGSNGGNSIVTFGSASATAYGGQGHCSSTAYSEAGGSFSATAGVNFMGMDGEMGSILTESYESGPAGNIRTMHYGKGGDAGNTINTGAAAGIAQFNYSTSALIYSASPLRLAKAPGGGGGGSTIANNGAQGMVIIHY